MNPKRLLAIFFVLSISAASYSKDLEQENVQTTSSSSVSLWDVFSSTLNHHPKIVQIQSEIDAAEGKQLEAQGYFDWQLENRSKSRINGFYDGDYFAQNLVRQLPWANTKISTGYRVSDGAFPVYEDIHRTGTGGELNIKVSSSLLRGRDIDPNRDRLNQAVLEQQISEHNARLNLNELLLDASYAFLNWYRAVQEQEIAQHLLQLAEDRYSAIERRVEKGDLAAIALTESQAMLIQRQENLVRIHQQRKVAIQWLSLYLRDQQGEPLLLASQATPVAIDLKTLSGIPTLEELISWMDQHPRINALDSKIGQWQSTRRLADNERLPQMDLEIIAANDFGSASESLDRVETYVGISFSVPLQQRQAKGKINQARAKIKGLEHERQQLLETMQTNMQTAVMSLENLKDLYQLRQQQSQIAERLAQMELKRFNVGDSDMFLLNAREQSSGLAQLELTQTRIDIWLQSLRILAQSARLLDVVSSQSQ